MAKVGAGIPDAKSPTAHREPREIGLSAVLNILSSCRGNDSGAGMYSYIRKGSSKAAYSSIAEGIGQSRITKKIENIEFDGAFKISDQSALNIIYDLIRE